MTLPERPVWRAVAILLLFALLGPPLGGMVGGLSLAVAGFVGSEATLGESLSEFLPVAIIFSVYGAFLAYGLGILPALVSGAVIAWHEGWRGPVTGFSACLLGVGIGAIYYMLGEFMGSQNAVFGAIFSILVCLVPTYILSRIARFWGRNDPVATPSGGDAE